MKAGKGMYYAIKFEDGRYLSFGSILDRHQPVEALTYKFGYSDGTSKEEQEIRKTYADAVESWFTTDISTARIFDSRISAKNAGNRGPYEFEVIEVEVFVREK